MSEFAGVRDAPEFLNATSTEGQLAATISRLKSRVNKPREVEIAIVKLEEALMWLQKQGQ